MVLRVTRRVHVFPDLERASERLAERLADAARAAVERSGRFRLVISGGKTPQSLYANLGGRYREQIPWAQTEVYFADERCVSPRSTLSNYGAARPAFLSRVPLVRGRVHRMLGELRPIGEAARRYERRLRRLPGAGAGGRALFDLVLLGMGPDGHTASLFPGQPSLRAQRNLVVAVPRSGQPPFVPRLTLTLPALSRATAVWFLVAGEDKAAPLASVLLGPRLTSARLPAALVRPAGPSEWFLDEAAAKDLPASLRSPG